MSLTYNALILCSIGKSDTNMVEMIENAFFNQGFRPITIGKNPYTSIDRDYLISAINSSHVIIIVLINENFLELINEVLIDNQRIFKIKKKPVMIFFNEDLHDKLKDKGTYSVMIGHSKYYNVFDLQEKMNKFASEFTQIVKDQELLKDLGKVGLILGGIGVGLGLLFSLFKGDD